MTDDTFSISELQAIDGARPGPCDPCDGVGYTPHPGSTTGRMRVCAACAGTGNALTVPMRRLAEATPMLLAVAKAALALVAANDAAILDIEVYRRMRSLRFDELRDALERVRL